LKKKQIHRGNKLKAMKRSSIILTVSTMAFLIVYGILWISPDPTGVIFNRKVGKALKMSIIL
jgi:hypothetical protein